MTSLEIDVSPGRSSAGEIFIDYWVEAMISSRVAGALGRLRERRELTEEDKAVLSRGKKIIISMGRVYQTYLHHEEPMLESEDIYRGQIFIDVFANQGREFFNDAPEYLAKYNSCIDMALQGAIFEGIEDAEKFFAEYSSLCSIKA